MKRKLNKESTTAPTPSTAGVPSLELDLQDAADRSSVTEVRSLAELADSDDISAADGPAATWLATADATSRLPDPPTSEEAAGDPSATRSGRWSATGMPLYARAMHAHPVLDAAGERELAATIEARAADLWSALLGDEVMAPFAIERAAARIEGAGPLLAGVRRAVRAAATAGRASARAALARAAAGAGDSLRALDVDHLVADELVDLLGRAAADPSSAPAGLPVPRRGRRLERYVNRVTAAARAAADARNALIQHNLGLVFFVAGKYRVSRMPLPDLVQEGTLGLMKAVDRFDYRRGVRFSTYASWWIRHAIGRALGDKARLVRLPVHVQETRQRLEAVRRRLRSQLSRDPSVDEIAAAVDTTVERVEAVLAAASTSELSLDQPVGDDGDRTRMDVFERPDHESTSLVEALSRAERASVLPRQLARLSPKESDVVRRRFGLDGTDHEWTLQEIADEYGLSRERIRQIEAQALGKLRTWLTRRDDQLADAA